MIPSPIEMSDIMKFLPKITFWINNKFKISDEMLQLIMIVYNENDIVLCLQNVKQNVFIGAIIPIRWWCHTLELLVLLLQRGEKQLQ